MTSLQGNLRRPGSIARPSASASTIRPASRPSSFRFVSMVVSGGRVCAAMAFRRAVAKADHEITAAFEVIGHLLRGFLGDRGNAGVGGSAKAFQRKIVP